MSKTRRSVGQAELYEKGRPAEFAGRPLKVNRFSKMVGQGPPYAA